MRTKTVALWYAHGVSQAAFVQGVGTYESCYGPEAGPRQVPGYRLRVLTRHRQLPVPGYLRVEPQMSSSFLELLLSASSNRPLSTPISPTTSYSTWVGVSLRVCSYPGGLGFGLGLGLGLRLGLELGLGLGFRVKS